MTRRRGGFTFIEMLMVMIVIGLLAGIAILKYIDLRHRAMSARVAADFETVRLAAYSAWYDNGTWPAEVGPGVTPPDLVPYLPGSFSFTQPDYTLDWENLAPPAGGPSESMQIGIILTSSNSRLQLSLEQMLGNKGPFFSIGNALTMVIVGPDGRG
jgi:prepilin-type N-terminal cleavage/methylation domain-containing protein